MIVSYLNVIMLMNKNEISETNVFLVSSGTYWTTRYILKKKNLEKISENKTQFGLNFYIWLSQYKMYNLFIEYKKILRQTIREDIFFLLKKTGMIQKQKKIKEP